MIENALMSKSNLDTGKMFSWENAKNETSVMPHGAFRSFYVIQSYLFENEKNALIDKTDRSVSISEMF